MPIESQFQRTDISFPVPPYEDILSLKQIDVSLRGQVCGFYDNHKMGIRFPEEWKDRRQQRFLIMYQVILSFGNIYQKSIIHQVFE